MFSRLHLATDIAHRVIADPAVYPFNLDTIYPEKPQSKIEKILVKLSSHYPVLDFCASLTSQGKNMLLTT